MYYGNIQRHEIITTELRRGRPLSYFGVDVIDDACRPRSKSVLWQSISEGGHPTCLYKHVVLSWRDCTKFSTAVVFQPIQNAMRAVFTEAIAQIFRRNRKIPASMARDLSFSCRGEYPSMQQAYNLLTLWKRPIDQ